MEARESFDVVIGQARITQFITQYFAHGFYRYSSKIFLIQRRQARCMGMKIKCRLTWFRRQTIAKRIDLCMTEPFLYVFFEHGICYRSWFDAIQSDVTMSAMEHFQGKKSHIRSYIDYSYSFR